MKIPEYLSAPAGNKYVYVTMSEKKYGGFINHTHDSHVKVFDNEEAAKKFVDILSTKYNLIAFYHKYLISEHLKFVLAEIPVDCCSTWIILEDTLPVGYDHVRNNLEVNRDEINVEFKIISEIY